MKMHLLNSRFAVAAIVLFPAIGAMTGCDSGPQLATVSGRVTRNGEPVRDLWVEFRPQTGRPAEGKTNGDGEYELLYTYNKKGTMTGVNRVTISSGGETDSRDNELSPRKEIYSGEVVVESGSNSLDFEVE